MTTAQPYGDPHDHSSPEYSLSGPTVLRILLGTQLRRLRDGQGITREAAGRRIRGSESKISRMELGRVSFKERDIADLLTLYGVLDDDERAAMLTLARRANAAGWWHQFTDVLPPWFEVYVGLEEAASRIRTYEVQFVPGLLQTEDYARAVIRLGHPDAPDAEIERRVQLRMRRQRLLSRPSAPHLWAVVDEAVLHRPVGGRAVMRPQLEALAEATTRPNVSLQVVPFEHGGHAAAGGPFSILRFAEPDLPDIVYLEQLTSALYLEKHEDVDRYQAVIEQVCLDAEPAMGTLDMIRNLLSHL